MRKLLRKLRRKQRVVRPPPLRDVVCEIVRVEMTHAHMRTLKQQAQLIKTLQLALEGMARVTEKEEIRTAKALGLDDPAFYQGPPAWLTWKPKEEKQNKL